MDKQTTIPEDRMFQYAILYCIDDNVSHNTEIKKILDSTLDKISIEEFLKDNVEKWKNLVTNSTEDIYKYILKDTQIILNKCKTEEDKFNTWAIVKHVYLVAIEEHKLLPSSINIGNNQNILLSIKSIFHILLGHHLDPNECGIPDLKKDNFRGNLDYIQDLEKNAIDIFSKITINTTKRNIIDYSLNGKLIRMIIEPNYEIITIYPLSRDINNKSEHIINDYLSVYL